MIRLPPAVTTLPDGAFDGYVSAPHLTVDAPGLLELSVGAFEGFAASPSEGLQLDAPLLGKVPAGAFSPLQGVKSLRIKASRDVRMGVGSSDPASGCAAFSGLVGLEELAVNAPGAENVFGQVKDLAVDGFRECSFADSLRRLELRGLDLSSSIWNRDTFAGLQRLSALVVTGSSGARAFDIAGDVLTPLLMLQELDVSDGGLQVLP